MTVMNLLSVEIGQPESTKEKKVPDKPLYRRSETILSNAKPADYIGEKIGMFSRPKCEG